MHRFIGVLGMLTMLGPGISVFDEPPGDTRRRLLAWGLGLQIAFRVFGDAVGVWAVALSESSARG